jgi:hypothetical protein
MAITLGGTNPAVTFPDATVQNTSAIVSGYVPYANLPAGSVLQVVNATSTSQSTTTSSSFVTTGFSASITPKFATSKILAIAASPCRVTMASGQGGAFTIYRNSTNLSGGGGVQLGGLRATTTEIMGTVTISYLDSPATTSSTTYTVYFFGNNNAQVDWGTSAGAQVSNGMSVFTLIEVAA